MTAKASLEGEQQAEEARGAADCGEQPEEEGSPGATVPSEPSAGDEERLQQVSMGCGRYCAIHTLSGGLPPVNAHAAACVMPAAAAATGSAGH